MTRRKISQNKQKKFKAQLKPWVKYGFALVIVSLLPLLLIYYLLGPHFLLVTFIYCSIFVVIINQFIEKFYNKKEKFLKIYKLILKPEFSFVILFLLFILGSSVLTINEVFLVGLFFSFSFYIFMFVVNGLWLNHLKEKEYRYQTVWTFYLNQTRLKWYILLLLAGIFIFVSGSIFGIAGNLFGSVLFVHYLLLALATSLFLSGLSGENNIREYCKAGLIVIEEGLSPNKIEYKLFPTIIDEFNTLTKEVYFPEKPTILKSDKFTKALFLSTTSGGEKRLKIAKESIKEMKKALDTKPKKSMFFCFINGLNRLVTGKKLKPQEQPKNLFEIKTGHEKTIKWIRGQKVWSIILAILIVLVPTYITIRTQAPEWGFQATRGLGENFAKLFFPIGEARMSLLWDLDLECLHL